MNNYKEPQEIRALNNAIVSYSNFATVDRSDKKNSPANLLRSYAFIHSDIENEIYENAEKNIKSQDTSPLTSIELCSFNNWFYLHPEKVAGETFITTSIHFPLQIKGDKNKIIETLEKGLENELKKEELKEIWQMTLEQWIRKDTFFKDDDIKKALEIAKNEDVFVRVQYPLPHILGYHVEKHYKAVIDAFERKMEIPKEVIESYSKIIHRLKTQKLYNNNWKNIIKNMKIDNYNYTINWNQNTKILNISKFGSLQADTSTNQYVYDDILNKDINQYLFDVIDKYLTINDYLAWNTAKKSVKFKSKSNINILKLKAKAKVKLLKLLNI